MLTKQTFSLLIGLAMLNTGPAQVMITDLPVYENGLIYDGLTMSYLKHTVDSLNLKFKQCSLSTTYYSVKQTIGHYITLDTGDIKAAFRDIQSGITYQAFKEKYPLAKIDSNNLIIETPDINYWKQNTLTYTNVTEKTYHDRMWVTTDCVGITESCFNSLKGKMSRWIFDYDEPHPNFTYFREKLQALYLTSPLVTRSIPEFYARNILYADCMIDTNTTIFLDNAHDDRFDFLQEKRANAKKYDQFMKYVEQNTNKPLQRYFLTHKEEDGQYNRDSVKYRYIHDSLSSRPLFKTLLAGAVSEALKEKYITGEVFEYYTAAYYSKNAALLMKRNRIVIGTCSRDTSPRYHIMNISQLAAKANNWQVFLRAHLDIMNDYALRNINSNYAERARNTYIRELEALDIDITNLLLGTALRISNGSPNHYFGSVGRLGRAFAETKHRATFEKKLLAMIADKQLDDYNRYLLQCLFLDYLYYLPEKTDRANGLQALKTAAKTTPAYLQEKCNLENYKEGIEAGASATDSPK